MAPWLSAAKSVPSGPNASGPIDAIFGPCPLCATARAEEGAQDVATRSAIKSQNFVLECMRSAPFGALRYDHRLRESNDKNSVMQNVECIMQKRLAGCDARLTAF